LAGPSRSTRPGQPTPLRALKPVMRAICAVRACVTNAAYRPGTTLRRQRATTAESPDRPSERKDGTPVGHESSDDLALHIFRIGVRSLAPGDEQPIGVRQLPEYLRLGDQPA